MTTTTQHGFGPTRKTEKSARREAIAWNNSGSGDRYTSPRTGITEEITAEAVAVEGGFACRYTTIRTTQEV